MGGSCINRCLGHSSAVGLNTAIKWLYNTLKCMGSINDAHTSAFAMVQISYVFAKVGFTYAEKGAAEKVENYENLLTLFLR